MTASAQAWEAVRRALGRLAAHVVVRELPPASGDAPVAVRGPDALRPPTVLAGAQERAWRLVAALGASSAPRAVPGARERGLLPAARLAGDGGSADFTLRPPALSTLPILCAERSVPRAAGLSWAVVDVSLPASFLALPPDPLRVHAVALLGAEKRLGRTRAPGSTKALGGWAVRPPKTDRLKIPRPPAPRVRWGGDAVLDRMPLVRRGLVPPPGRTPAQAFAAEHRRLAESAGLFPVDVSLLGVFPGVPILAVRRILVEEEGRGLRLWLKPDVVRARTKLRFITLLVGRQISSGRMLQAAL